MMRFVSDTTISRADVESVKYISDLILYAQILWHDYASWQKEIDAYNSGKASSLVNALAILMKLHDVDAESAKKLLWDETLEYERRYCEERDNYIKKNSPGPEVYRWFRLLELSTGGNAIWSFTTSRYNKSAPAPEVTRIHTTNGIVTNGSAADCPEHKSPEGEQPKVMNGSMINGNEKLKSDNEVLTSKKVTHARDTEVDDMPNTKKIKVNINGKSTKSEQFAVPDEDLASI